jgi:hypothetical protein
MKTSFYYPIVCAVLLTVGLLPNLPAQETPATGSQPIRRVEKRHVIVTAEVTAIDPAKREITLKGPEGNEVTLVVSKAVKRLDEVQVGDSVQADYLVSVVAELRKPTPEEAEHPLVFLDAAGRTTTNLPPVGVVARRFKVVTTIEELNLTNQTVTDKGPLGNTLTAVVRNPDRLKQAHVGENIVIVYSEALALSLEKMTKKN